jgi:hypothetical protein
MATKATVVTIANAGTTTPTISLDANRFPIGIVIPAAFTGTTLTFKASPTEAGTPVPVYYESTLYSVTVAPDRHVSLNPNAFASVKFLQIVSNLAEGAERNLTLVS